MGFGRDMKCIGPKAKVADLSIVIKRYKGIIKKEYAWRWGMSKLTAPRKRSKKRGFYVNCHVARIQRCSDAMI